MKRLACCFLLCSVGGFVCAVQPSGAAAGKLIKRAAALTGNREGVFEYIPPRGDLSKYVEELAKMVGYAQARHQPLIIYSPDAQRATRATTTVFAMIRPNYLRGCTVICAVGQQNDSHIRPVVEATGAKLYVEPLP